MEKITRITKSIKIDPELWKDMQHYCIDHDIDYSSFIESLIKEKLKNKAN
ncbi:MAG: hypothetical protein Q8N63_03160 [Nanoarchaeota archaeon]|nr:hypothetical protein [Nanoarchaeota archaeon]